VIQGQQYDVTIAGPPGGFGLFAVGSGPLAPMPIGIGDLAIDPFTLQVVAAAALPPNDGTVTIPLACSTLVPIGHVFAFQAASVGAERRDLADPAVAVRGRLGLRTDPVGRSSHQRRSRRSPPAADPSVYCTHANPSSRSPAAMTSSTVMSFMQR
jgi:hypothetical protein